MIICGGYQSYKFRGCVYPQGPRRGTTTAIIHPRKLIAGWGSGLTRQPHKLNFVGSNPTPANF